MICTVLTHGEAPWRISPPQEWNETAPPGQKVAINDRITEVPRSWMGPWKNGHELVVYMVVYKMVYMVVQWWLMVL